MNDKLLDIPPQLAPDHPIKRFLAPEESFMDLLGALKLPSVPPTQEEWEKIKVELREQAQASLGDAQAQLMLEMAQSSETPGDFSETVLKNIGEIFNRAGWRIPNPPANDSPPSVNPASATPIE